jgi:hypothetical protein
MDVFCHMVTKASHKGLLQPLAKWALQNRISLYADDVVILLRPSGITLNISFLEMLQGSEQMCKRVMSSPSSVRRGGSTTIQEHLPCQLSDFPSKYLPGCPTFLTQTDKAENSANHWSNCWSAPWVEGRLAHKGWEIGSGSICAHQHAGIVVYDNGSSSLCF